MAPAALVAVTDPGRLILLIEQPLVPGLGLFSLVRLLLFVLWNLLLPPEFPPFPNRSLTIFSRNFQRLSPEFSMRPRSFRVDPWAILKSSFDFEQMNAKTPTRTFFCEQIPDLRTVLKKALSARQDWIFPLGPS